MIVFIYVYIVDIKQNSGIQLIRAFERLVMYTTYMKLDSRPNTDRSYLALSGSKHVEFFTLVNVDGNVPDKPLRKPWMA